MALDLGTVLLDAVPSVASATHGTRFCHPDPQLGNCCIIGGSCTVTNFARKVMRNSRERVLDELSTETMKNLEVRRKIRKQLLFANKFRKLY